MKKKKNWPVCISRLKNMESQYESKKKRIRELELILREKEEKLKLGSKARIMNLRDFVFPIFDVDRLQHSLNFQRQ